MLKWAFPCLFPSWLRCRLKTSFSFKLCSQLAFPWAKYSSYCRPKFNPLGLSWSVGSVTGAGKNFNCDFGVITLLAHIAWTRTYILNSLVVHKLVQHPCPRHGRIIIELAIDFRVHLAQCVSPGQQHHEHIRQDHFKKVFIDFWLNCSMFCFINTSSLLMRLFIIKTFLPKVVARIMNIKYPGQRTSGQDKPSLKIKVKLWKLMLNLELNRYT